MPASSPSSRFSCFARLRRMSKPEAVKNLTGMAFMHASLPGATARWLLPVPTGPWSTRSSLSPTNSRPSSRTRPRSGGILRFDRSWPSRPFALGNPAALSSRARLDCPRLAGPAPNQDSMKSSWAGVAWAICSARTPRVRVRCRLMAMTRSLLAMVPARRRLVSGIPGSGLLPIASPPCLPARSR